MKVYVSMSYGVVALLFVMISLWCIKAMAQDTMQQLKVQQLLKRLNKHAVKSIKVCYPITISFIFVLDFAWVFGVKKKIINFERVFNKFFELFLNRNLFYKVIFLFF